MDRVERNRAAVTKKHCQACGDPVDLEAPHPRALVIDETGRLAKYKRPVFCDRKCWKLWATKGWNEAIQLPFPKWNSKWLGYSEVT